MSDTRSVICPYFVPADNNRQRICLAGQEFISHRYADSYCVRDEHVRCAVYVAHEQGIVDPLIEEAEHEL